MTGNIKFSIITPVYKAEEYLDECVQSVLAQNYENFELILVDDGSPDRCGELCDIWVGKDSRISAYHKPNGGPLQAREHGIHFADGDYYMFLDADDTLKEGCLEKLYKIITGYNCDCIVFGYDVVSHGSLIGSNQTDRKLCDRIIRDRRTVLNLFLNNGSYNSLCRKCIRSGCFVNMDLTEYYRIRYGEDLVHSLCILKQADSFLFIEDRLYNYRYNCRSATKSIQYDNLVPDFTVSRIEDNYIKQSGVFLPEDYDRLRNTRLDNLATKMRRIIRSCSSAGKAISVMERFRSDNFVESILSVGYRTAPDCAGIRKPGFLYRLADRFTIFLFRNRRYRTLILFTDIMHRIKK